MSKQLEDILEETDGNEPETKETGDGEQGATGVSEGETSEKTSESGSTQEGAKEEDNSDSGDANEDNKAEEGEKTGEADDDIKSIVAELKREQEELKQVLRVTRRENATLRAKLGRIDSTIEEELGDGEAGTKELSKLEQLQQQLQAIGQSRGAQLELMVEQMSEMKKYSDILDVCSAENVSTLIETAAKTVSEQQGTDVDTAMLEIEVDIWSRPNPYKYLYGIIKQYHPKYASKSSEDSGGSKTDRTPPKAATSIQDAGGGGSDKNTGWTADKIDRMPEDELHKVPGDIYEKYLSGELR